MRLEVETDCAREDYSGRVIGFEEIFGNGLLVRGHRPLGGGNRG